MKAYIKEYDGIKKTYYYHQVEFLKSPSGYVRFQRIPEILTQKEFDDKYVIEKKWDEIKRTVSNLIKKVGLAAQ